MFSSEIDEEPSIVCPQIMRIGWMDQLNIFLKNKNKQNIDDINVIFQFALNVAARGSQISLSMLTHGIDMRLKARNKKSTEDTSNVIFETPLELVQDVSVII